MFYTEHNLPERYHGLTRFLNKLTYGANRHVIAVSDHVMRAIRHSIPDKGVRISVVRNSIPVAAVLEKADDLTGLKNELRIPADHKVVGTVAVFRKQKALGDWIKIAAKVIQERNNVTFLLVGHGPMKTELEDKIKALGIPQRLLMPGFRADGRRIMRLMDIFLMTSQNEGMPLALLEAMAAKLPVVATSVGGIPEVVRNGEEGFLVEYKDIQGTARALEYLLDNDKIRLEMAEKAFNRISSTFNLKDNVRKIENMYMQELQKGTS